MTEKREHGPYCWVTWLASIMAGEQSCLWRSWFMTQYTDYKKASTDGAFTASYNIKHTSLLHKTAHWLKAKGLGIEVEKEFKYKKHGVCLSGKIDILAKDIGVNGPTKKVVYDTKTGRPKHSHHVQVMIYMEVIGADAGYLIYDGDHVEVAPPDEAFRESFHRNLKMLAADDEPFKSPSRGECRYCKLTEADCEEKVDG